MSVWLWRIGIAAMAALVAGLIVNEFLLSNTSPPEPVTESEARHLLAEAVIRARVGDFDGLCDLSGSHLMCDDELRDAKAVSIPEEPPAVTLVRSWHNDGGAGIIPQLCSIWPDGTPVRTDFSVHRTADGGLVVPHPVYWSGIQILPTRHQQPLHAWSTPATASDRCDPKQVESR